MVVLIDLIRLNLIKLQATAWAETSHADICPGTNFPGNCSPFQEAGLGAWRMQGFAMWKTSGQLILGENVLQLSSIRDIP